MKEYRITRLTVHGFLIMYALLLAAMVYLKIENSQLQIKLYKYDLQQGKDKSKK